MSIVGTTVHRTSSRRLVSVEPIAIALFAICLGAGVLGIGKLRWSEPREKSAPAGLHRTNVAFAQIPDSSPARPAVLYLGDRIETELSDDEESFGGVQFCSAPDEPMFEGATCEDGDGTPVKPILGVDQSMAQPGREALWRQQCLIPWESFAYGEYIGPHRTPHVGEYRLRVNDQLEFVFLLNRTTNGEPYRLNAGDVIQITSAGDAELDQTNLTVLSDGTISVKLVGRVRAAGLTIDMLQDLLNEKYVAQGVKMPAIVVQVLQSDTPLRDLRDAVDARYGSGGQSRIATVSPDGTIQLPLIQSVPAIGLTLDELAREVNARYHERIRGIEVTPILSQRAPRFVYVLGEVNQPGQVTLTGPTTVMQAISQAGGWLQGAKLESVVVLRRDEQWRLIATRLNLRGALSGQRPIPSDEIWLRDSDIVLVPKMCIQRLSELIDLYFTKTVYSVFRFQGIDFQFDNGSVIVD